MAKMTKEELMKAFGIKDDEKVFKDFFGTPDTHDLPKSGFAQQLQKYEQEMENRKRDMMREQQKYMEHRLEEQTKKLGKLKKELELKAKLGAARDTEAGRILFDEPEEDKLLGLEELLRTKET